MQLEKYHHEILGDLYCLVNYGDEWKSAFRILEESEKITPNMFLNTFMQTQTSGYNYYALLDYDYSSPKVKTVYMFSSVHGIVEISNKMFILNKCSITEEEMREKSREIVEYLYKSIQHNLNSNQEFLLKTSSNYPIMTPTRRFKAYLNHSRDIYIKEAYNELIDMDPDEITVYDDLKKIFDTVSLLKTSRGNALSKIQYMENVIQYIQLFNTHLRIEFDIYFPALADEHNFTKKYRDIVIRNDRIGVKETGDIRWMVRHDPCKIIEFHDAAK